MSLIRPVGLILVLTVALTPLLFVGARDLPERGNSLGDKTRPIDKLAIAAMVKSGDYKITERDEEQPYNILESVWDYVEPTEGIIQDCSRDMVTLGLVIMESYARPSWRRAMELSMARSFHSLTGTFPNWSYGIGQIRIDTARRAIENALERSGDYYIGNDLTDLSDEEIFALLEEPCNNIKIAALVTDLNRDPADSVAEIAAKYRGSDNDGRLPGVVTYENAVALIASEEPLGMSRIGSFQEYSYIPAVYADPDQYSDAWPLICLALDVDAEGLGQYIRVALPYIPISTEAWDDGPAEIDTRELRAALTDLPPGETTLRLHMFAPIKDSAWSRDLSYLSDLDLLSAASDVTNALEDLGIGRTSWTGDMSLTFGPDRIAEEAMAAFEFGGCSILAMLDPAPIGPLQKLGSYN